MSRIWLSSPHMGGQEEVYVKEAFDTNWIAPLGPHVDQFEKELATYTKVAHAAALSSGTAALHLALILLGVGTDDFVICQSMTFSASANPIRYQGAIPVFVDSEPDTWNMDPNALEDAVKFCLAKNKLPKAIIPVHLYGMPAKMDEILIIAKKYQIPIIEDAAEALGSTYNQNPCGGFGHFGVLSFNGNKIITTSGGGALISNDNSTIQKARYLATQARDPAPHYQHSEIGYNYRMSNVCAGIGRGQLEVLNLRVQQRRQNFEQYQSRMKNLPGVAFQPEQPESFSNRWLTALTIDPAACKGLNREKVRLVLEKEDIETRPLWKPMHLQPVFGGYPYFGGIVSEALFTNGLCLPSGSNLSEDQFNRIFFHLLPLWQ
ncbi:aminotransferase class I/II-fold pyridoxal phosphate-dependent enzyme [Flavihumibacter cheonanensis]|uniref:aminotransferase class I/II-fold pyridoxal phosphate-dependent enzyme n=1 Tax=Flavihumibacter cheonanensis TaxID=1442385 RepID=UPI001EF8BD70|nr:aminotransferase class I/II-fold pyridoxal phosphate-dependent enzyme [Flavihumibacter cheonanensis]MCG7753871.1 aminotransferase class I/II-fold pyridoxal phosphate-dependent enzyme [Flavihumibacter cheonanensis]